MHPLLAPSPRCWLARRASGNLRTLCQQPARKQARRRQALLLMSGNSLSPRNALAWLWLTVFVIALDQATKAIVLHTLTPYVPHPVIPGFFNWTLAFNTGAAFSFLAEHPQWS